MKVQLAYGRNGIEVDLPDGRCEVIRPSHQTPEPDPLAAVIRASTTRSAARPCGPGSRTGQRVVVSVVTAPDRSHASWC